MEEETQKAREKKDEDASETLGDDTLNTPEEEQKSREAILPEKATTAAAWHTNTTMFYYDKDEAKIKLMPFYMTDAAKKYTEAQRKAMKVVYDYLKDKQAFDNVTNGKIRRGTPIYFIIDPTLNKAVQDASGDSNAYVILMSLDDKGE